MTFNKILGGMALSLLIGAGLSSCSNDMDKYAVQTSAKTLIAKAPKIQAYSGNQFWGKDGALGTQTRANGDNGVTWEKFKTQVDTEDEAAYIDQKLPENGTNIEGVDYDFIYISDNDVVVEMVPVYAQTNKSEQVFGIFYYDAKGVMHEEPLWENITYTRSTYESPNNMWGIKINIPAGTAFGFYISKCTYHPTDDSEWSVEEKAYTSSHMNRDSYFNINNNVDKSQTSKVHAVTWTDVRNGVSKNYLGFEDWADFDYQDLVFTMTPNVRTVDASTYEPGTPNPPTEEDDDDCTICGHDKHDPGQCPDCKPGEYPECRPDGSGNNGGGSNNPGGSTPDPVNPPVVAGDNHTNEVEVNLGIDTKGETSGGKYNESHLSIHVRSATNVDMFIPMPLDMVCPADDMEIVQKHLEGFMDHGGEFTNAQTDKDGKVIMEGGLLSKMTYKITNPATQEEWTVSVYVEYVAGGKTNSAHNACGREFNEDGIHIWTEGLDNQDLMDYLQEAYGDGITFEIWNYYNEDETLESLKQYLDRATITFLDKLPDYFINAFGEDNYQEGKDCNVGLDDANDYDYAGEGGHLNGSGHNKIYESKAHKAAGTPETGSGE